MISIEQIGGEIAQLEEEKPTHATMQKLSALYIVRDHMILGNEDEPQTVMVTGKVPMISESEFSKQIYDRDVKKVLPVLDELMETLRLIQPRLYNAVMVKLAELG